MRRRVILTAWSLLLISADAPPKIGAWQIKQTRDAMTDKMDATASVYSTDDQALLSVGCWSQPREAPIAFFLTTREYLGSSSTYRGRGRREITFRIDEESPETLLWYYGNSTATQFRLDGVSEFGNILRRGSKLLARLITYRGGQIDAKFDVTGASEAIDQVRLLCAKGK